MIREVHGNGSLEAVELHHAAENERIERIECDAVLLQLGFSTKLGPLKEWGFELEKGAIRVDGADARRTSTASGPAATSRPSRASSS